MEREDESAWKDELKARAVSVLESDTATGTAPEVSRVIHDLQTCQVELELQNEELRRTQYELQESRDRYEHLYDHAPVGFLTLAPDGEILEGNLTACAILGCERNVLVGRILSSLIAPESQDEYYLLLHSPQTRGRQASDIQLATEERWVRMEAVQEGTGAGINTSCVLTDVTDSRRTEEELLKVQRLESLGILAGGIAHDFNNLLSGIFGNIDLALVYAEENSPVTRHLHETENALQRAQDLTQQLLTFSRGGSPNKVVLQIGEVIRDSAAMSLGGSNVRCDFQQDSDLRTVEGDVGQLNQVFNNLFLNARQAMPTGGVVRAMGANATCVGLPDIPDGEYVKIQIQDEGVGIPKVDLPKVFDPFFTTKPSGSGLGLATAHSIIRKHGGRMRVESEQNKGTTFTIVLPASEQGLTPAETGVPPAEISSESILFMDDEDSIRNSMKELLAVAGYEVEAVVDGEAALDAYYCAMKAGRPFDIVILDLTIPGGMGGEETVGQIHEMDPRAKVIASSGYSDSPILASPLEYGFCAAVQKPYRLQELRRVVQGTLSRS